MPITLRGMSLDYLRMYQAKMAHQAARNVTQDPAWEESRDFPEVSFPPVIVISGGSMFSGRIAGPDGYNARMRGLLKAAPDSDPEILEGLLDMYPARTVFRPEQLAADEPVYFEHLYLIDVRSYQGHRVINLPALSLRFSAIDGWNIGELPE